jgi:type IV secretion system protein VirB4
VAQARIDAVLAEHGRTGFAAGFLRDAGLGWAADLAADFPVLDRPDSRAPQKGEE